MIGMAMTSIWVGVDEGVEALRFGSVALGSVRD
jgi:hypothetical protein